MDGIKGLSFVLVRFCTETLIQSTSRSVLCSERGDGRKVSGQPMYPKRRYVCEASSRWRSGSKE